MTTTEESRTRVGTHQASPGWGALLRGSNGALCIALAGGVMLHAVNVYVTITILPSVVDDIGGAAYYAWNTTLFILASIVGSALSSNALVTPGLLDVVRRVFGGPRVAPGSGSRCWLRCLPSMPCMVIPTVRVVSWSPRHPIIGTFIMRWRNDNRDR